MSELGFMVDRAIDPASIPVLVDLGYVTDKPTRDCADRLRAAGVSHRHFSIEGFGRLLVKLPPTTASALIQRFRFAQKSTYWQCTHCRAALARVHGEAEAGKDEGGTGL